MFRRILVIGAAVLAAGSVSLAPVSAQDGGGYGGCNATVSDTNVQPGQSVTVAGSGAAAAGTVTASIDGAEVGSGTADAAGDFSFAVDIPASASGNETLSVSCGATRGTDAIVLGIGSDLLPETGSSSSLPMTQVAVAALALGAVALGAARLRSHFAGSSL